MRAVLFAILLSAASLFELGSPAVIRNAEITQPENEVLVKRQSGFDGIGSVFGTLLNVGIPVVLGVVNGIAGALGYGGFGGYGGGYYPPPVYGGGFRPPFYGKR